MPLSWCPLEEGEEDTTRLISSCIGCVVVGAGVESPEGGVDRNPGTQRNLINGDVMGVKAAQAPETSIEPCMVRTHNASKRCAPGRDDLGDKAEQRDADAPSARPNQPDP